jgi:di/tricarboxylate transporter
MSSVISRNKEFAKVDWITLATFISLVVIGWMIYASGHSELMSPPPRRTNAGKQLIAIILSAFCFLYIITDFKFLSTLPDIPATAFPGRVLFLVKMRPPPGSTWAVSVPA